MRAIARFSSPLRLVVDSEPMDTPDLDDLLQRAYRYALSLARDEDTARDLVQDACLSIARRGGPWKAGYVLTSVRNRFIDTTRRADHHTREVEEHDATTDAPSPFDGEAPGLAEALATLRPIEREVLFLHAVEGFSASQIGALTDQPRGTVLSLLHRTKAKLRPLLSPDLL